MKIAIIHPKACSLSAKMLGAFLGAVTINPFKTDRRDFTEYDVVFNYGCNREIVAKKVVNNCTAVARCIDKVKTFKALQKAGVSIPDFVTERGLIPLDWETIVCRLTAKGAKNEGLEMINQEPEAEIPQCELYTRYFDHKHEFRIVVLGGIVVGNYEKKEDDNGEWQFVEMEHEGFEQIHSDCIWAADALRVDYVGFDVLANTQKHFVILEANTGPVLIQGVDKAIKTYLKGL